MNKRTFEAFASNYDGASSKKTFEGMPEVCPECDHAQTFDKPFYIRTGKGQYIAFAFYQCKLTDCRAPFFGVYRHRMSNSYTYLHADVPRYVKTTKDIPKIIDEISPSYRKIYSQADKAEQSGLNLISGPGYRKALEFLLKDYAIFLESKKDNKITDKAIGEIKKLPLMQVINSYISFPKVKAMAKRATWLGNDETHYERRIENSDVEILKSLMRLSILFIEADEEAEKLEKEIKPNSK